jgi:DeoR/GlpR family transcriptional regulator of sugar metabolism
MFKEERLQRIVEELVNKNSVSCTDLAERYGVSVSTIRTDLADLESKGLITRTHGGAMITNRSLLFTPQLIEPPLGERLTINIEEKSAIGRAAAALVEEGDTIMIDGGTTTPFVYRNLANISDLTIVSSSAIFAAEMHIFKTANIYLSGGYVRKESFSLVGEVAESTVSRFRANKAILGIDGISIEQGLTTFNFLEAGVKKQMIAANQKLIIVADHSKIGKVCLVPVAPIEKVSYLVTDSNAPKHIIKAIEEKGIKVIVA